MIILILFINLYTIRGDNRRKRGLISTLSGGFLIRISCPLDPSTVLTDVNNNEVIEDVEDAEGRVDYVYLLANEVYLLEYYLKQIEEFDESEFITEDYSDGTTYLLN